MHAHQDTVALEQKPDALRVQAFLLAVCAEHLQP